mgnify:CR=1 FL=1
MLKEITLGTAVSQPGTIQYGKWEFFTHPTGLTEWLPVIIAQGTEPGPTGWLTAGIHGPEHSGPSILYRLLNHDLVSQLKGTIIAIPALMPSGLRTKSYVPYHEPQNPNRMWPDGRNKPHTNLEKRPPTVIEQGFARLFEEILETAVFLIDYHNAGIGSIPFVFRDRVLYRPTDDAAELEAAKQEAQALSDQMQGLIDAFGFTVINEYPTEKYIKEDLHRSTSGATLLIGRVPAITVELGVGPVPELAITSAGVKATRNVLRWANMLDGESEPLTEIPVIDPGYPTHRTQSVRCPETCILLHRVDSGDIVQKGDILADMVDVWGKPIGEGVLRSPYDGFIWSRPHGIYTYEGQTAVAMSIRDENPLIGPYPEDYFKEDEEEN